MNQRKMRGASMLFSALRSAIWNKTDCCIAERAFKRVPDYLTPKISLQSLAPNGANVLVPRAVNRIRASRCAVID
jgi:hypothetical protein